MKKKLLFLLPSIIVLFSCVSNNAKNTSNLNELNNNLENNDTEQIKIKFNTNGGRIKNGKALISINKGSTYGQFKNDCPKVERKGASDNPGWYYLTNSNDKIVVDDSSIFNTSITLYANWSLYNVTFNSGVGTWSGSTKEEKVIENTSYVYSDDIPNPSYVGGKFLGWHDGNDFVSFPYIPKKNITLTAKYDVKEISLFFLANDGYFDSITEKSKAIKVPYGTTWKTAKEKFNVPKAYIDNDEKDFDTWKINGNAIDDNYQFTSASVLSAYYDNATTVTFDIASNNGKWSDSTSAAKKGKILNKNSRTLTDFKTAANIKTSKGGTTGTGDYDQLGWFYSSDASGDAIKDTDTITATKTIYAFYKNPYTITFTNDGEGFDVIAKPDSYIRKDSITCTVKQKEDYTLEKDNLEVKFGDDVVTSGYTFTIDDTGVGTFTITDCPGKNISVRLSAPYTKKIEVTFLDESTGEVIETQEVIYGTKATKPVHPTESSLYEAKCYTDSGLTKVFDFDTLITEAKTLYLHWRPKDIDVSYLSVTTVSGNDVNVRLANTNKYPTKFSIPEKLTISGVTKNVVALYNGSFSTSSITSYKTRLVELELPDTITAIPASAFNGFSGLTKIKFNKVTTLNTYSFSGCSNLETIGDMSNITTIPSYCFKNCKKLKNIDLTGVTEIGTYAFQNAVFTKTPDLSKITKIGNYGFQNCSLGDEIDLNGCTSIGNNAFQKSTVQSVKNLKVVSYYIFESSTVSKINSIEDNTLILPDTITKLNRCCFMNCSNLTNIVIPSTLKTYDGGCFSPYKHNISFVGNSYFTYDSTNKCIIKSSDNSVILFGIGGTYPSTIEKIADWCFAYDTSLTSFTIPSTIKTVGAYAFAYSGLKSVVIPNNVTTLGEYAYAYCSSNESISIGTGVTSLLDQTFRNNSSLTSVVVPKNITKLGTYLFVSCTKIENIEFYPENFTSGSIPQGLLNYNTSLKKVKFHGTKAQWESYTRPSSAWLADVPSTAVVEFEDGTSQKLE